MKNIIMNTTFPFFALGLFSCASDIVSSGSPSDRPSDCPLDCPSDKADLNEYQDKKWYLDEVRIGMTIININRENKPDIIYTIMFNAERFAGIGAPNRFFGLYTANKDYTLLFNKVNSTRMHPIHEMYTISEHDYLTYIERANRWKIHNGKLELYSSKEDGTKIILVFSNRNENENENK